MTRRLVLLIAVAALMSADAAWSEEADSAERNVLGGSPPIYAGQPQAPLVTSSYKRYRAIPRDTAPTAPQSGERCATRIGLFGPGPQQPVGTSCAGRDANGQMFRGRIVPDGTGRFCVTGTGIYGPGGEQPIGMPCSGETKNGLVPGRIAAMD
jgi:hypothetical protein